MEKDIKSSKMDQEKLYAFCITIIKNLLKRENYRDLFEEYANKEITFSKYQNELEKNSQKYTIDLHEFSSDDIEYIKKIIGDIGEITNDLSESDVFEIFSLCSPALTSYLKNKTL